MFGIRKLFLIFVGLCTVIGCNAKHDDFREISSDVRSCDSKIADTASSHYEKYMPQTSDPGVPKEQKNPSEDRAEDENNTCKKMLREFPMTKNDNSDEELSRKIVKMLLSRTRMRSKGSLFWGLVELEATESELEALVNFTLGKSTLREVVPILNKVITVAEFDLAYKVPILHNFIITYINEIFIIVGVLYLYIIFWLLKYAKYDLRGPLFIVSQVILTVIILIICWKALQEVNIELLRIQCQSTTTQSTNEMKAMNYSLECKRYHDAIQFSKGGGSALLILLDLFLQIVFSLIERIVEVMVTYPVYCGFAIYLVYVYKKNRMNERAEQFQYRRRYIRQ